jgi:hypothetical protein
MARTAETAKATALTSATTTTTSLTHPGGIQIHPSWANMPRELMARDFPRLRLCQNMSKSRQKNDVKYIEGIHEGDYYNDKTDQIYGRGPLTFSIILDHGFRGVQYDDAHTIIDHHVSSTDPRMRKDADGVVLAVPSVTWTIYLHQTKQVLFFRNEKSAYYQVGTLYHKLQDKVGINRDQMLGICTVLSQNTPGPKGTYERPVFQVTGLADPELLKLLNEHATHHRQAGIRPVDLDPPDDHGA